MTLTGKIMCVCYFLSPFFHLYKSPPGFNLRASALAGHLHPGFVIGVHFHGCLMAFWIHLPAILDEITDKTTIIITKFRPNTKKNHPKVVFRAGNCQPD